MNRNTNDSIIATTVNSDNVKMAVPIIIFSKQRTVQYKMKMAVPINIYIYI